MASSVFVSQSNLCDIYKTSYQDGEQHSRKSASRNFHSLLIPSYLEVRKVCLLFKYSIKSTNQMHQSVSQIYWLSFKYSSTCFGHPLAHHQELINCSSRLWFTYCHKRYCFV